MKIVSHPKVFLEEWPALAQIAQKRLMALQFDRRRRYSTETGKTRSGPGPALARLDCPIASLLTYAGIGAN